MMIYRARPSHEGKKAQQRNRLVGVAILAAFIVTLCIHSYPNVASPPSSFSEFRRTTDTYDLPKYLNVHSFLDPKFKPDGSSVSRMAAAIAAKKHNSILRLYRELPGVCGRHPYRPHLRSALERWGGLTGASRDPTVELVRRNDTMLVHILSGKVSENGTSLNTKFTEELLSRANMFDTVVVLVTADKYASATDVHKDVAFIERWLTADDIRVKVCDFEGTDEKLYLMHSAKHLFVHRGYFSALGALACQGTVYYTDDMADFNEQNAFRWLIEDGRPAVERKVFLPKETLNHMGPVTPSCCNLEEFGKGDGEKIICGNAKGFVRNNCWILSVGCGNRWSFEEFAAVKTGCKIQTFDCTGNFVVPPSLKGKAKVHKLCLGQENDSRKNFIGWKEMIEIGAREAGMKDAKTPALVKMDIEGHEFPVLDILLAQADDDTLPEQLAMEVHSTTSRSVGPPFFKRYPHSKNTMVSIDTFSELFRNMSSRGYRLVHRADNPFCLHCSEVTLVRTTGLPDIN